MIFGWLLSLLRKPPSVIDTFLNTYESLNQRDAHKVLNEMREQIIVKVDQRFHRFINGCKDYNYLYEITHVVSMYMPLKSYQKIRARSILAQLLLKTEDNNKKDLIAYLIKSMELTK